MGVLPGYYRFFLGSEFKVLVLKNAGVGNVSVGVVDDRIALEILLIKHLGFKMQAAVLELAKPAVKKLVYFPGVQHLGGQRIPMLLIGEIVHSGFYLDACQQGIG